MVEEVHKTRRVCMVAYTFYESDNRVRRYAETLIRQGFAVDVISICGPVPSALKPSSLNGVNIYHMMSRVRDEKGMWSYALRLGRFFALALAKVSSLHLRNRYDVIHVHNMPDFLVFTAILPKLTGAKVILDIHDLTPEMFAEKFSHRRWNAFISALKRIEQASAAFADHVIISNDLWRDKLVARSVKPAKCTTIINYVDSNVFYRRERTRPNGRWILLFPGTLQRHQGVDIAIQAVAKVRATQPAIEFHIYGTATGAYGEELQSMIANLDLGKVVKLHAPLPLDEIPQLIAESDIGVVPKKAEAFGNEAFSTKILEFMSQAVPVIVSKTSVDNYYFSEGTVRFFPPGDPNGLADAILEVIDNADLRESLIANGLNFASENSWENKKDLYLNIFRSLGVPCVR